MTEMNLEKFNPTKAELLSLADEARKLEIKGVDDKAGYDLVHSKRIELKNARVKIAKTGKEAREEAIEYQRRVIAYEKELIAIIEPVEADLYTKQLNIDQAKEKAKRLELLPERIKRLEEIGYDESILDKEAILAMDNTEFEKWFNDRKAEYLAYKEQCIKEQQEAEAARLKAEQEKIEAEKRALEEAKRLEEAKKQAEKEAHEKAMREAELAKVRSEEEKQKAIEEERKKAEDEKRKIIEEQERKERERQEAEARAKAESEEKARKEKEEQEALEKRKKYQNFLDKHGYTEKSKDNFHIQKVGNKIIMFKKVGEITI